MMGYCACQHLLRGDGRGCGCPPGGRKTVARRTTESVVRHQRGPWRRFGGKGAYPMAGGQNGAHATVDTKRHLPRIKIYQTPSYLSRRSERAAIVLLNPLPQKVLQLYSLISYILIFFFYKSIVLPGFAGGAESYC